MFTRLGRACQDLYGACHGLHAGVGLTFPRRQGSASWHCNSVPTGVSIAKDRKEQPKCQLRSALRKTGKNSRSANWGQHCERPERTAEVPTGVSIAKDRKEQPKCQRGSALRQTGKNSRSASGGQHCDRPERTAEVPTGVSIAKDRKEQPKCQLGSALRKTGKNSRSAN